jgi:hypothetical protein
MAADLTHLLRGADPIRQMPVADPDEAERLRRAIVAGPVRPAGRRSSRRPVLALALAALLILAAGFTVYRAALGGSTPDEVQTSFESVQKQVPLPPGASWRPLDLPRDVIFAGDADRAALMMALDQAQCAWFRYWRDGDAAERADAVVGMRRLRTLMPLHKEGQSEDAGGFDAASLQAYDGWVTAAAAGDGTGIRDYLRANC